MSLDRLRNRCPSAHELGNAILRGYALAFTGWSKRWNGGVATIIENSGQQVEGVLFEVTMQELVALDDIEGKDYRREQVDVEGPDGSVTAQVYRRNEEARAIPAMEYFASIVAQYRERGFRESALIDALVGEKEAA